ncbi:MAG: hypothetical protein LBB23_02310 [Rickettsiales bacterium]|jgi:hypothetical protein|nr:hypothetical protein [Rickettsiales bacterium]
MQQDLTWWIQVIAVPLIGALTFYIMKFKAQCDLAIANLHKELSEYKLDVARTYASISYIKDVENRLTNHLLRIEHKLEQGTSK